VSSREAAGWGFDPDDVGLITGNRRVNPDARIRVVVARFCSITCWR